MEDKVDNPGSKPPTGVVVERKSERQPPKRFVRQQVPTEILENPELKAAMSILPPNYNLEIPKTVWRVKQSGAKCVALQFPEGLLLFACPIADILERFAGVQNCVILGDVTYGACCIDDFSARAMGAEFLVHYGHSCLVPVDQTLIPCLYVFVDITIDVPHLIATVKQNFSPETRLSIAGTIQFGSAIQSAKLELSKTMSGVQVPQSKPLSPGEVLGCTAPVLKDGSIDAIVFVADGRFHLEAIMIANPKIPAFRYDPYGRVLTRERYDHVGMRNARKNAIEKAQEGINFQMASKQGKLISQVAEDLSHLNVCSSEHSESCHCVPKQPPLVQTNEEATASACEAVLPDKGPVWGLILGTLGRQGNPRVLDHLRGRLSSRHIQSIVFLVSELSPAKIAQFKGTISVFVQIACPRLSIDWGEGFPVPVLTPFEAEVALGFVPPFWASRETSGVALEDVEEGPYPMDYYSKDGGPWNSTYPPKAFPLRKNAGISS